MARWQADRILSIFREQPMERAEHFVVPRPQTVKFSRKLRRIERLSVKTPGWKISIFTSHCSNSSKFLSFLTSQSLDFKSTKRRTFYHTLWKKSWNSIEFNRNRHSLLFVVRWSFFVCNFVSLVSDKINFSTHNHDLYDCYGGTDKRQTDGRINRKT